MDSIDNTKRKSFTETFLKSVLFFLNITKNPQYLRSLYFTATHFFNPILLNLLLLPLKIIQNVRLIVCPVNLFTLKYLI